MAGVQFLVGTIYFSLRYSVQTSFGTTQPPVQGMSEALSPGVRQLAKVSTLDLCIGSFGTAVKYKFTVFAYIIQCFLCIFFVDSALEQKFLASV
jgi:hypothetical protein